jgi:hypothetical protein
MSRKKFRLDRRPRWFLEIQPTVILLLWRRFGLLPMLVSFPADDGDAVEFERAASETGA